MQSKSNTPHAIISINCLTEAIGWRAFLFCFPTMCLFFPQVALFAAVFIRAHSELSFCLFHFYCFTFSFVSLSIPAFTLSCAQKLYKYRRIVNRVSFLEKLNPNSILLIRFFRKIFIDMKNLVRIKWKCSFNFVVKSSQRPNFPDFLFFVRKFQIVNK